MPEAEPATDMELSIVMPCLNEAETLATCIKKARAAIDRLGLSAEIIVADNGSTDGSIEIAESLGARVVRVPERGYGSALRGGIATARGRYVIMGDADDSYDFGAIDSFVDRLRDGSALVMGNRFAGGIEPGAMPWKHRWIGNPVLTALGRLFFRSPAHDFHCGLRGFTKAAYERMALTTTGMEFASEMVVQASIRGLAIDEVPVRLHKDGRTRPPHLRSWRDGWRHLRFLLLYSPTWLFFVPGLSCLLFAAIVGGRLIHGPWRLGAAVLDIHTLLVTGFLAIVGYQLVIFGISTRVLAVAYGLLPPEPRFAALMTSLTLERGLLAAAALTVGGVWLLASAFLGWRHVAFGALDPRVTMREAIPAVVLLTLGVQTAFASFFVSVLGLRRP